MIKNLAIKMGGIIAVIMMFSPFIILSQYDKFKSLDFYFFLIISILYDVYMYSVIKRENNNVKEHYYKYIKNSDKKLNLKTNYKEKYEVLEKYIENLLEEYF
jgi:Mn2+/Fe2+ NRAMP family transporter